MDIRPIRTEADHDAAVREIERLWGAAEGTPEGDALDVLITLVDAYETEHFKLPAVSPVEIVKQVMAERGYTQVDLGKVFGSRSRASDLLSGRRGLSLEQIRRLHAAWKIPAEALIGEAA
ncbi:helix-turn-helix domain-containing protein [Phenylobacterium sp.]|jgi:HTH-type transcriptional regulator/antitoxin HigA|uniref:helix-turn-helix domain-containing protein n=1 Tax=Phenylobacterium sp. TaxID=1871053 RepID=UPI002F3FB9E4